MIKHHVKATNMELTDAISDYLGRKIGTLDKFVRSNIESIARIEVGKTTKHHNKGDVFRAEVNLEFDGFKFRAVAEADDLYKAIDEVRDSIAHEVTRASKKKHHLLKRGHQKIKDMMRKFRS